MSRLTTFHQSKAQDARGMIGYCAKHRCPGDRYCEDCIGWYHNRETLEEIIDVSFTPSGIRQQT